MSLISWAQAPGCRQPPPSAHNYTLTQRSCYQPAKLCAPFWDSRGHSSRSFTPAESPGCWLLLSSGAPSIKALGCGERSVPRRGGWRSPTHFRRQDKPMRKAGEDRAQPGREPPASVRHLAPDFWCSLGEVTPVPGCFYPPCGAPRQAGCSARILPLSGESPSHASVCLSARTTPRLQSRAPAARACQVTVAAVSSLHKRGESSRPLHVPKPGAEVASAPTPNVPRSPGCPSPDPAPAPAGPGAPLLGSEVSGDPAPSLRTRPPLCGFELGTQKSSPFPFFFPRESLISELDPVPCLCLPVGS